MVILVVGVWMWMKSKGGSVGSVGEPKPSVISQRFPMAQAVDTLTYMSIQERRLPCGRILRRTVESRDGAWSKTVTLMSPEGRILKSTSRTIEPETCNIIKQGRFVPGLWADCTVSLD